MQFIPWQKERGIYYKIIDEYTLFYLSWVKDIIKSNIPERDNNYWEIISKTPGWQAWSGLAFEAICYKISPKLRRHFIYKMVLKLLYGNIFRKIKKRRELR